MNANPNPTTASVLHAEEQTIADLLDEATGNSGLDPYHRGLMARAAGLIRELVVECEELQND